MYGSNGVQLFLGLFASLDRLSVPTAEGPLPLQKYEPMWKHSGGKLMGPIPLTPNSTAPFSFDFVWFVFVFCLCVWIQSLLIRIYVVSVERRLCRIRILRHFLFSYSKFSSTRHCVLAAVRIRKRRFKGIRHVRQSHYNNLKYLRLVRRVVRAQSQLKFTITFVYIMYV